MSEAPQPRRGAFESLWPWPGVILLVLLAAWFFYMGAMAGVDDISSAFLGLGGVTSLLVLLGLRAANLGKLRAGRSQPRGRDTLVGDDDEDEDDERDDEMLPVQRRTAIATEITTEIEEPARLPANEPIPLHPPARDGSKKQARALRRREQMMMMMADEEEEVSSDDARPTFNDFGEVAEAIERLEAKIERERVDRGSALARLASSGGDGDGDGGGRESSVALEERLNKYLTIPAFNAAMNQKVFPQINTMMRKALQEQIGPEALKERMTVVTEDGEDPETSMTLALQLAEARQALEAHIEEVQKDRNALREEIRSVRENTDTALREMEERGGAPASSADGASGVVDGALGQRIDDIARTTEQRIDKVFAALDRLEQAFVAPVTAAAEGEEGAPVSADATQRVVELMRRDLEEARASMARQFAEVEARLDAINGTAAETTARIDKAEVAHRRLSRRVKELAEAQEQAQAGTAAEPAPAASDTPEAEAEAVPAVQAAPAAEVPEGLARPGEVDALRDALTTIIEQNRAIQAHQQVLSARFEATAGPDRAEPAGEPTEKG